MLKARDFRAGNWITMDCFQISFKRMIFALWYWINMDCFQISFQSERTRAPIARPGVRAAAGAQPNVFHRVADAGGHGRPVQIDPMKPTLKAPGTKRLKLKNDELV
jgi:hypothetical protein